MMMGTLCRLSACTTGQATLIHLIIMCALPKKPRAASMGEPCLLLLSIRPFSFLFAFHFVVVVALFAASQKLVRYSATIYKPLTYMLCVICFHFSLSVWG